MGTTWGTLEDHLGTTWGTLGNHLGNTWRPLGDHFRTTLGPLGDHLGTKGEGGGRWLIGDMTTHSGEKSNKCWLIGDRCNRGAKEVLAHQIPSDGQTGLPGTFEPDKLPSNG